MCIYVGMSECLNVCMYVCTYICMYLYIYYIYIYMCICIYIIYIIEIMLFYFNSKETTIVEFQITLFQTFKQRAIPTKLSDHLSK